MRRAPRIPIVKVCPYCDFRVDQDVYDYQYNYDAYLDFGRGARYVCPPAIIHYVINHHYLPPPEFIDLVIRAPMAVGPIVNQEEFKEIGYLERHFKEETFPKGDSPLLFPVWLSKRINAYWHYIYLRKVNKFDLESIARYGEVFFPRR